MSRGDRDRALERFDAGEPLPTSALHGRWRGSAVPTGHVLDGLLGTYGWWGKAFRSDDDVDPLLFEGRDGRVRALEPRLLPLAARTLGVLPRSAAAGRLAAVAHPLLATRRPRARLRAVEVRGRVSAAMVYDHVPVLDAFRRDPDDTGDLPRVVLGLMDCRGHAEPFCFRLERAAGRTAG
ncbi:GXWXG domain-containing protein [Aquipuribacter sp. SD81]|uniref:GXWXG domain-containing protein n=1 Tax=Aquipuribacter sp. SD81 TaxID=3127703 RepID=UPI003017E3AB